MARAAAQRRLAEAALAALILSASPRLIRAGDVGAVPDRLALETELKVQNDLLAAQGKNGYPPQGRRKEIFQALQSLRKSPSAEKFVEFAFSDLVQATMTRQGGTFRVRLPKGVEKSLKKSFPGYHLPENSDYVGTWEANFDAYLYFDTFMAGHLPFSVALADFNLDGEQDVALVIFRDAPRSYKVAAFHRHGDDYSAHLVMEAAGMPDYFLVDVHGGVSFSDAAADPTYYIWEKGRYVQRDFLEDEGH